jgi:hypothetical protein
MDFSEHRSSHLAPGRLTAAVGSILLLSGAVLAAVVSSIFLAGVVLHDGVTPDFPWLSAAGEWMLVHGRLPAGDVFSWSAAGRPWVLYQWGFEIVVAAIQRIGGYGAVATAFAWASLAIYLIVPLQAAPRRTPLVLVAATGAAVLAVLSVNLSIRPMLATSAGLLLQHLLLNRVRRGAASLPAAVAAMALLYAIWANLHLGFALGLISLLLSMCGDWIEIRRMEDPEAGSWTPPLRPLHVLALLGAAGLGSLITPYGPRLHLYLLELSAETALNQRIDELGSPNFAFFQFQLLLALLLLLTAALIRRSDALRPADLLHLVCFCAATFLSARFVVWAALYIVLLVPTAIAQGWPEIARRCPARGDRPLMLTLGLVAVLAPPLLAWRGAADPIGPYCAPFRAAIAAYVEARLPRDRLLTDPITGSCMIAAAPGVPVFFDTRFDFYGETFSLAALDALALKPGWREYLDEHGFDAAVLDRGRPLAEALAIDASFETLFRDEKSVVVRRLH